MKEIMLNKSFAGSWGLDSDINIPHEIINLFRADNGKIYIYVPAYGGYGTKAHPDIECLLLTGNWNEKSKTTEVRYLVTSLKRMHDGGNKATEQEREALRKRIIDDDIRYGGKLLHEIRTSDKPEPSIFYLTFEAEKVVRPIRKLFLTWGDRPSDHKNDQDQIHLTSEYNYQRQRGYIQEGTVDYDALRQMIDSPEYWTDGSEIQPVDPKKHREEESQFNFLTLIQKEYDETAFTNMFQQFFEKYPDTFAKFTREVLGVPEDFRYKVDAEVPTKNKKGRMDLLAYNEKAVIIMENKIKSGLNGIDKHNELSQLTTYIEDIDKKYPEKEYPEIKKYYFLFEPDYNDIDISLFDQKRGAEFKPIKYSSIYRFFSKEKEVLKAGPLGKYADDFLSALKPQTLTDRETFEQRFFEAIQNS